MVDVKKVFNELLEEAGINEEDLIPFEDLDKMVIEEEGVSIFDDENAIEWDR